MGARWWLCGGWGKTFYPIDFISSCVVQSVCGCESRTKGAHAHAHTRTEFSSTFHVARFLWPRRTVTGSIYLSINSPRSGPFLCQKIAAATTFPTDCKALNVFADGECVSTVVWFLRFCKWNPSFVTRDNRIRNTSRCSLKRSKATLFRLCSSISFSLPNRKKKLVRNCIVQNCSQNYRANFVQLVNFQVATVTRHSSRLCANTSSLTTRTHALNLSVTVVFRGRNSHLVFAGFFSTRLWVNQKETTDERHRVSASSPRQCCQTSKSQFPTDQQKPWTFLFEYPSSSNMFCVSFLSKHVSNAPISVSLYLVFLLVVVTYVWQLLC